MRMPYRTGLELLPRIKALRPDVSVVVATVINDVQQAVVATKAGAYNYLLKPLQLSRLEEVLDACLSNIPVSLIEDRRFQGFITRDQRFIPLFNRIKSFAEAEVPVLIHGETGTGKELVAQLIHSLSPRVHRSYVAINVAALSPELFESELFGHKKGSFTSAYSDRAGYFETANDATLFLDEIGELREEQQQKLLRVLQSQTFFRVGDAQERKTSARLVFATNKDLQKEVDEGRFRSDLYYRIASHAVELPPLRDRAGDIAMLADYFLHKYTAQFGRSIERFAPESLQALCAYSFPGNVRELEGCISAAVLLEQASTIQPYSLPEHIVANAPAVGAYSDDPRYTEVMQALAACNGNQTLAAQKLGVARETLNRWLRKYQQQQLDE
jgi:DNA-binding NtrC family response regulator